MDIKDVKGYDVIARESKRCSRKGTGGAVEVALNTHTGALYVTYRSTQSDYSLWDNDWVINLTYIYHPVTVKEAKELVEPFVEEAIRDAEIYDL